MQHEFTQEYHNMLSDYIVLNMRSAQLLATTKYTGFVRWHQRNEVIYNKFNRKITKYIANMYGEASSPYQVTTMSYSMPSSIESHLNAWKNQLESMKEITYKLYCLACEASDLILAHQFNKLNKTVVNELFELKRVMQRIKGIPENDLMFVNKEIHDYFEHDMKCKKINFSI